MPGVWISIGSNQQREASIRGAVVQLRARYGELHLSSVYESDAVGFDGEPFLNLVAGFLTELSVAELNRDMKAIEDALGRVRGPDRFAPRTLDLDLLTYGDANDVIDGYWLPRDEILEYAFVLGPLAEAAPDELHPRLGKSYRELWAAFDQGAQPMRIIPFRLPVGSIGRFGTIVSGGQTGVDRAALDAALGVGMAIGGWCPEGRRAEDGEIDERYPLRETPSCVYSQRTEWNVRDSDATLILCRGAMTGGTRLTADIAACYRRPLLVLDLGSAPDADSARVWLREHRVEVLNVAGPREEGAPGIYSQALAFLGEILTPTSRWEAI